MSKVNWQPTAAIQTLKKRAALLHKIRSFFYERGVLEVETPLLSQHGVTDLHLDNFSTQHKATQQTYYLQTSPEYAMKRLLASGSGDIYQLSKVCRQEESGRLHNPEFTLLEWYRLGYDHHQLMDETDAFLQTVISSQPSQRISYRDCFLQHIGVDILTIDLDNLKKTLAKNNISIDENTLDYNSCCDLLMSHVIEPKLGLEAPLFIYDYPVSQAALANIRQDTPPVAERFELYINGVEIANGFHELTDATQQWQRFQQDNALRQQRGIEPANIDDRLIAALQHGLPNCAGVALGIDRLLMAGLGLTMIREALAFDWSNA